MCENRIIFISNAGCLTSCNDESDFHTLFFLPHQSSPPTTSDFLFLESPFILKTWFFWFMIDIFSNNFLKQLTFYRNGKMQRCLNHIQDVGLLFEVVKMAGFQEKRKKNYSAFTKGRKRCASGATLGGVSQNKRKSLSKFSFVLRFDWEGPKKLSDLLVSRRMPPWTRHGS